MDVVGGDSMIERGPQDEGPHPKSGDACWQESVTLIWRNKENYVGGFHRIGHEPNYREGPPCLFNQ